MRALVICFAVTFVVLLALPEAAGAPACSAAKKDEILSQTVEAQSSKTTVKAAQQEKEAKETKSTCKNGLESGSKSLSETKELKLSEEEQSRVAAETKTATGTEKIEQCMKKKKDVTVSEKKTLLIYYLVSYKRLPSKRCSENLLKYYKRIFPKENNLNVFYRKIFKAYEKEQPAPYIERVEYIMTHVYPELDCRLDMNYLDQFDHYYTLKYSRKLDEKDESYFPRVLKKLVGESCEQYKKRMACLVAALDEEDFSHITFDDTDLGYKIGVRKTPAKSVSSPSSTAQVTGQVSSSTKKSREQAVDVDKSEKEVIQTNSKGTSAAYERRLRKKKTLVEKEENIKSFAYRVAYTRLPQRAPGQLEEDYYRKFFGEFNKKLGENERNEQYLRILIQYKGETENEYVRRIDLLFDKVYPEMDIRTNNVLISLLEHYYKAKYDMLGGETEDQWFARVLVKFEGETATHYKERISCIQTTFSSANWSKVIIEENTTIGFRVASKAVAEAKAVVAEEKKESGCKKNIVKRSLKRSCGCGKTKKKALKGSCGCGKVSVKKQLKVPCGCKKIAVKKALKPSCGCKKAVIQKVPCGCKKSIPVKKIKGRCGCKKIVAKAPCSCKRISPLGTVMGVKKGAFGLKKQVIGTSLGLVAQTAKKVLSLDDIRVVYAKTEGEDILTYFKRITLRSTSVSTEEYITTVTNIRRCYPELPLWYSTQYLYLVRDYYTAFYCKVSDETEEKYFQRIVAKETFETDELWAQRVECVREIYPSLRVWYDDTYYETVTKNVYLTVYKKVTTEDEFTYYQRITRKLATERISDYIKRVSLVRRTFCTLPLWYSTKYLGLVKEYYTTVYNKLSEETDDIYFKRILFKDTFETDELWAQRVELVHELYPSLTLWYDNAYYEPYTKKVYLTVYKKATSEDDLTYYKRITTKLATETVTNYVKRISLVKRTFFTLPLWYRRDYLGLVKEYYTAVYTKLSDETDEVYFQRIVMKESCETDEQWALRAELVYEIFPRLPLWFDVKYYDTFTKQIYRTVYKKSIPEDEITYYKRITTKLETETVTEYVKRISFVRRTFCTLPLWYSTQYIDLVKEYYTGVYTRLTDESEDVYFKRIVTKEVYETDEQLALRARLVYQLYPSLTLWFDEKYYDTFTKQVYLTVYNKLPAEDDITYYKRVTTKIATESITDYVKRVAYVRRTFFTLPLWYDAKYLQYVKPYYTNVYTKLCDETDDLYFKRIITRETFETDELWAQRVELVREIYPSLTVWYDDTYYETVTKRVYLTVYKKVTTENEFTYYERITRKLATETVSDYVKRVTLVKRTFCTLPLWYSTKYLGLVKDYYSTVYARLTDETDEIYFKRIFKKESYETDEQLAWRAELVYELFPRLTLWYDDTYYDTFTKNVYLTVYKKSTTEDESTYYKRITTKLETETVTDYVKRVSLVKRTFFNLPLWYKTDYLSLVKEYYTAVYTKLSGETNEVYFHRIVTKDSYETVEQWAQRAELVYEIFPTLPLWFEDKYYDTFTKQIYLTVYKKSATEDQAVYYKRITTKLETESVTDYVRRISLVKRTYCTLPVWYDVKFVDYVKEYYTAVYSKQAEETEELYFKRIVTKEIYETDEQWSQRVVLVNQFFPDLLLWYDVKYYDSFTKQFYQTWYKKLTIEDEFTYYTRICTKAAWESDAVYVGRLTLVEKTFSGLSLWYSETYLDVVKPFYTLRYSRLSGEADEAYFTRLFARDVCDISDQIYAQRIRLVELLTVSNSVWYDDKYYELYTKSFYQIYYKRIDTETCEGWLARAILQLPGECEENTFKRITLIKKSTSDCGCWTVETLDKLLAAKTYSAEYISKIRSAFFVTSSYQKTASSCSSSTKATTSESNESEVAFKRGVC